MKYLAIALALVLPPAGAEFALRLRRGPPPDESAWVDSTRYSQHDVHLPFFRRDGASWVAARPRSTAAPFAAAKPAGTKRIFLAGESVAQRFTTAALAAVFPPPVEVVNAGMGAYDSARVAGVLRDVLEREPDLVVVLAGNNDAPTSPVWYPAWRLNLELRRLWLWRRAQDRLRPRRPPVVDREALAKTFAENLRSMARAARAKNVALVFCTLPVNERDWPPTGELPLYSKDFALGWTALQEGRAADAASHFRRFTESTPHDPMGHYWLAKATGDRAEYAAALEWNWPDRCTPRRNDIIRRVAREEGARLADLDAYLRALSPGGAPGWEYFLDGVHWLPELDVPFAALIAGEKPKSPPASRAAAPVEGYALHALADAMKAQLENDPPILSEQAIAELRRARQLDGAALDRYLSDPALAARDLAANPWTAFLATRSSQLWPSAVRHADAAVKRKR